MNNMKRLDPGSVVREGEYEKLKTPEMKAGDLAAKIFKFMKRLDPDSVVGEGEFANEQNAMGIPERIRARYNDLLKRKLAIRKEMVK